jgi:tetratricopeptide (TPR) repeat protein
MTAFEPLQTPIDSVTRLPVMLPSRPVGRDDLLREVFASMQDEEPVLLHGPGGAGKTAIAAFLASATIQQGKDVLWLQADGASLAEMLVQTARTYKLPVVATSDTPTRHQSAVRTILRQSRPFVVIDGQPQADALQRFVTEVADEQSVLITSDVDLPGPWARVAVPPLDTDNAVLLFRQKSGTTQADVGGTLVEIVEGLGRLPMAIVIAARAMAASKQTPAEYAALLREIGRTSNGPGPRTAIIASYRAINNALQGLLLMLSATPRGTSSAPLMALLSNVGADKVDQAMTILSQLMLCERYTQFDTPVYRLHPLVRAFARDTLVNSNRLASLETSYRDAILRYTQAQAEAGAPGHARLALEMDSIVAVAHNATKEGDHDTVSRLTLAISEASGFVQERGYVYELLTLRQGGPAAAFPAYGSEIDDVPASAPEPAFRPTLADEDEDEARARAWSAAPSSAASAAGLDDIVLPGRPSAYGDDDDFDVASLLRSTEPDDADELDDDEDLESTDVLDSDFGEEFDAEFDDADDYDDADEYGDDEDLESDDLASDDLAPGLLSLRLAGAGPEEDDLDDDLGTRIGRPEDVLASAPFAASATDSAIQEVMHHALEDTDALRSLDIAQLKSALGAARASGNVRARTALLRAIGQQQVIAGHEAEALVSFNELLDVYDNANDVEGTLETLDTLSYLLVRTDNAQVAVVHATRGLELAGTNRETRMRLYKTLGDAHQNLGDTDPAIAAYNKALEIARRSEDTRLEGIILHQLGYAYLDAGDPNGAIDLWEQALLLFKSQLDHTNEGRVKGGLGVAYAELQRWGEAIRFQKSALHIAREVGDRDDERSALNNLAQALVESNQLPEALTRYRQALHLAYLEGRASDIVSVTLDTVALMRRSQRLLPICALLIEEALRHDGDDPDLLAMQGALRDAMQAATATGTTFAPVAGTARDYAANAYDA